MRSSKTILALGEVLWDVFDDGPRFGGAPANFACACAQLGQQRIRASLASAVGTDDLGTRAVQRLIEKGVNTAHVTVCDYQTGQVNVTLDDAGRASYEFVKDPAWYHLSWTSGLQELAGRSDVVCFGTLGQFADDSRAVIQSAVRATPPHGLRIFDINLRPPYWSQGVIVESLNLATVLKLNDEELPILARLLDLTGSDEEILRTIMDNYSLRLVALTRGANGSLLLGPNGNRSETPGVRVEVVDTVGAGDAFTAALALGLTHGLDLDAINRWATDVAAFVCTQPGGTPAFPEQYRLPPDC